MTDELGSLQPGGRVIGLDPSGPAEIVSISRFGTDAINVVFRVNGKVSERLVFRDEASSLKVEQAGRRFGFDADGNLVKLASEALRIRLAHLFDPYLAISSSQIEALPHQITAVYGTMLPKYPFASCLPTIRAPARRSWRVCSSRN
jgi:hypothetical protein